MSDKATVLYIEDDSPSRLLVQVLLAPHFNILTAPNALEGLNLLSRNQVDLVLTDINLPDMSGKVIAARIRATTPRPIPIVAVTSDDDVETRAQALAAGCTGFINKPIDGPTFPDTVRKYLGGYIDELSDGDRRLATGQFQVVVTAELEKTMRQLAEDNAELRNLEQVKTAFLTQVSHELRTPLTVLSGYAQMLRQSLDEETAVSDMHRELAKEVVESIRRMHSITNEIVVMARLASNALEASKSPNRFEEIAAAPIAEYSEAFRVRNITFERQGDKWSQVLLCDGTLISMALNALLSNAIKATPNGGTITMSVDCDADKLHVAIQDSGVGIRPDHMPLLFKPFFTAIDTKRGKTSKTEFMGMGMGVGLPIVTRIVQVHQGQIWAESQGYDEKTFPGSTFHMLLPIMPTGK